MFTLEIGGFRLVCVSHGLPNDYSSLRKHALLLEEFSLDDPDAGLQCCLSVGSAANQWPSVVVAQRYGPSDYGFHPGALIVSETNRLFVGAGERLLAYDLAAPARLWEDATDWRFFGWARHGEVVIMSAETELAAWDLVGRKLWTTFVEPPWDYVVQDGIVTLDVMGAESRFPASTGPVGKT